MSKIKSFNDKGEAAAEVDFADELLVLDKGDQAVKDVVVATLAARRAGTASTLGKGEVAGSNKKPWKQKGTGNARAGFRRSPVWRTTDVIPICSPRRLMLACAVFFLKSSAVGIFSFSLFRLANCRLVSANTESSCT